MMVVKWLLWPTSALPSSLGSIPFVELQESTYIRGWVWAICNKETRNVLTFTIEAKSANWNSLNLKF